MKQINSKSHSVDQSNPVYHDIHRLLKSYWDAMWNLELETQHVKGEFEIEYESNIDNFLESIYLTGADLNGSKSKNYAKDIGRSNRMLSLLDSTVEILCNKHKFGEQYYWILYYAYFSPQQLQNVGEIIDKLRSHIANIFYHTYYRKRPQAIKALSGILWRHTVRNCPRTMSQFFPDS